MGKRKNRWFSKLLKNQKRQDRAGKAKLNPTIDSFTIAIQDREPGWFVWCETVCIVCPDCQEISILSDHTINGDGRVNPSVVCPGDKCGYHHFCELLEYDGPTQEGNFKKKKEDEENRGKYASYYWVVGKHSTLVVQNNKIWVAPNSEISKTPGPSNADVRRYLQGIK